MDLGEKRASNLAEREVGTIIPFKKIIIKIIKRFYPEKTLYPLW